MARVVLTADRTLMSEYQNNMFFGFSASFPKKFVPPIIYYRMFAPSVPHRDGEAIYAPYALRKLEAALLADGYGGDDVVIAHPSHLDKFIGDDTLALGVSTMDPLGYGPVTSTFTNLYHNPAYVPEKFREVVTDPAIQRHNAKVIVVTRHFREDDLYLDEKQAYHEYLQKEGVQFHYNRRIHAKLIVVDKRIAVISSMNFIVQSSGGSSWEAGMISIDDAIVKSVTNTVYELLERID